MRLFVPISCLIAAVLAAPSLRRDTKEAALIVKFDKSTLETEITVTDSSSRVLGQSCTTQLNSGPFANFPISTDLDENGAGNVTLGTNTYLVHELAEFSGGITCARIYNNIDSFIRCSIEVPGSLQLAPVGKNSLQECFVLSTHDMDTTSNMFAAPLEGYEQYDSTSIAPEVPAILHDELTSINISNSRADCNLWVSGPVRIGDGDPHQNYLHTQLTETLQCSGNPGCEVSAQRAKTYAISFSWGGTYGGWISGGFAVEKSTTTGQAYACGGNPGDSICIWYSNAHTAYSVQTHEYNPCYGHYFGERYVLVSPNQANRGGGYYCVSGSCRSQGDNWMQRDGRAGGP